MVERKVAVIDMDCPGIGQGLFESPRWTSCVKAPHRTGWMDSLPHSPVAAALSVSHSLTPAQGHVSCTFLSANLVKLWSLFAITAFASCLLVTATTNFTRLIHMLLTVPANSGFTLIYFLNVLSLYFQLVFMVSLLSQPLLVAVVINVFTVRVLVNCIVLSVSASCLLFLFIGCKL